MHHPYHVTSTSKARFDDLIDQFVLYMRELYDRGEVEFYPTITEGWRTEDKQREYVEKGTSQTMASWHRVGLAVDVWPTNPATGDPQLEGMKGRNLYFEKQREKARELGLHLAGDWDKAHIAFFPETAAYKNQVFDDSGALIAGGIERLTRSWFKEQARKENIATGRSVVERDNEKKIPFFTGPRVSSKRTAETRSADNTVIAEDARVPGMTFDNIAVLGDTMRWLQPALRWTQGNLTMAKYLLATIATESRGNPNAKGDYEDPDIMDNPRSRGLAQVHDIHGYSPEWRENPENSFWFMMNQKRGKEGLNILQWRQYFLNQGYQDGPNLATKLLGKMQGSVAQFHDRYGSMYEAVEDALAGVDTTTKMNLRAQGKKWSQKRIAANREESTSIAANPTLKTGFIRGREGQVIEGFGKSKRDITYPPRSYA